MLLSSTGFTSSEALETDIFPLAVVCHDVDICVRCNIAAATAAHGVLPELVRIIPVDEEARRLLLVELLCRVKLNHVAALTVSAPELPFVYDHNPDNSALVALRCETSAISSGEIRYLLPCGRL